MARSTRHRLVLLLPSRTDENHKGITKAGLRVCGERQGASYCSCHGFSLPSWVAVFFCFGYRTAYKYCFSQAVFKEQFSWLFKKKKKLTYFFIKRIVCHSTCKKAATTTTKKEHHTHKQETKQKQTNKKPKQQQQTTKNKTKQNKTTTTTTQDGIRFSSVVCASNLDTRFCLESHFVIVDEHDLKKTGLTTGLTT